MPVVVAGTRGFFIGEGKMAGKPDYRHTDMKAEVRKADRGQAHYYPVYQFTGRTFTKRDVPGPKPS